MRARAIKAMGISGSRFSVTYLKQNEGKRPTQPPLPDGATLDSVWEQYGNLCIVCGAPKNVLARLGIGRQAHHVLRYAQAGHKGPVVPICTLCHPVVTDRQRIYWFYQRVVLKAQTDDEAGTEDAVMLAEGAARRP